MAHLPTFIYDLALILMVAGATTIIFKMLKQPLVLGYLVAGFLAGPHFDFFFTVSDKANVHTWSEIGIIFLLFALGLEFSIKKLSSVGHTAVITAITEVVSMLTLGFICGQMLGWNIMDSVFLGGMLSMSSTTIIIKAFDDLNMKGQRFTDLVFGTLIIEDIVGIIMMVMLSTIAVSTALSQLSLIASVLQLTFALILWFILGVFLIPELFRRIRKDFNDETLLIVALGLCLSMVVLATKLGFSAALGAFLTGSILAETREAKRIEHLLLPVKDLFGAVFFVSVGMMVAPSQLLEYWYPIVIIVLLTIFGKLFFSTFGMLLSGQTLKTAMLGGFSLAQIGEFAFIIAGLGQSLKVTSDFLYPIVVAVSVITTFTTPFCVKIAIPCYEKLNTVLPKNIRKILDKYNSDSSEDTKDRHWQMLLKSYFLNLMIHSVLLTAIVFLLFNYKNLLHLNLSENVAFTLDIVMPFIALLIMSPFLKDLLFDKRSRPELISTLWFKKKSNRLPLMVLLFLRIIIAMVFIFIALFSSMPLHPVLIISISVIVAYVIYTSDWLLSQYLRLEASFLINLNENHLREQKKLMSNNGNTNKIYWLDENLFVAFFKIGETSDFAGKALKDLSFREKFGINVLQIIRKNKILDIPGGNISLNKNDHIVVLGSNEQLNLFSANKIQDILTFEEMYERISLRNFIVSQKQYNEKSNLLCYAVIIDENSPLLGKTIKDSNIRDKWHCLVIGLERDGYSMRNPHISLVFAKNDIIWVLGKDDMIGELARADLL